MKHINFIVLISCLLLLFSCQNDELVDFDGPWIKTDSAQVTLYTRPLSYSNSPSPNEEQIQVTLKNQNDFIDTINHRLGLNYTGKVFIYLYNYDEALNKIGMNGGGRALTDKRTICYAFNGDLMYYPNWTVSDYMGLHEMVHIVSISELGKGGTRLMTEGYAVAIDGSYAGYKDQNGNIIRSLITEWMAAYVKANKVYRPSELLNNPDNYPEEVFYPQSGYFVDWLFKKYGVEKINRLFTVKKDRFKTEFQKITGDHFDVMEDEYLQEISRIINDIF